VNHVADEAKLVDWLMTHSKQAVMASPVWWVHRNVPAQIKNDANADRRSTGESNRNAATSDVEPSQVGCARDHHMSRPAATS